MSKKKTLIGRKQKIKQRVSLVSSPPMLFPSARRYQNGKVPPRPALEGVEPADQQPLQQMCFTPRLVKADQKQIPRVNRLFFFN